MTTNGATVQPVAAEPVRIALAGAHGFGIQHLRGIAELQAAGAARLVGVADPVPPDPATLPGGDTAGVVVTAGLGDLLAAVRADVVVVATPIHTHAALAETALLAGADVLLEKPTAASLAEFDRLRALLARTGRRCQVGFQSLGGGGVDELIALLRRGELGDDVRVAATGTWVRPLAYWRRSRWAGRRRLDGTDVVDGVLTNPLAHAVATALRVAGARRSGDVERVETDLYRVNDVECDDTSVVRVATSGGVPVLVAATLCAREQSEPLVTVRGSRGHAVLHYTSDVLDVHVQGREPTSVRHPRRTLLADLLQRRADGGPLICALEDTGAFMRVLDAVRTAEEPRPVPAAHVDWHGDGEQAHPVLRDVEGWVRRAAAENRTFSELGAPWAAPAPVGSA
ncbi:Gfo/Idh/MocA family protein [Kineococcus glutinatus]|uniref:Gfo/Idh/MocA family oxidoreductase n=1 Tax=Kineococcus glutinatus TaxID=1070872 RepID=A0ABP9I183_9ACTN